MSAKPLLPRLPRVSAVGAAVEVTEGWHRRGWAVCTTEVLSPMQEVPVMR